MISIPRKSESSVNVSFRKMSVNKAYINGFLLLDTSFILSKHEKESGYIVSLYNDITTWIPKEIFEAYLEKIDKDRFEKEIKKTNKMDINSLKKGNEIKMCFDYLKNINTYSMVYTKYQTIGESLYELCNIRDDFKEDFIKLIDSYRDKFTEEFEKL